MPIAFEIQQGLPCVFTNLSNLLVLVHVFLKNPTSEIQIAPTRLTLNLKFCCQFISESLMCPFRFFQ